MDTEKQSFGRTSTGEEVCLYTLRNTNGLTLKATDYGAKFVELHVPDRNGVMADIITGFDTIDPYLIRNPYFGAFVGRCANRISGARFILNDKEYQLDCNAPPNHLHGGAGGFDKKLFTVFAIGDGLRFQYLSPDGEQGYPGNLTVTVDYRLTDENELVIDYLCTSDKDTPVNLTNHSYFNLRGHNSGDVLGHVVTLDADCYNPTGDGGIPTGEFRPVEGTPMDLRQPVRIGERIHADYPQLHANDGFDVNYVLNRKGAGLETVCVLEEPESGRRMEVKTTLPGMQFYTANNIKGDFVFKGKGGYWYAQHCGICLETQFLPNAVNTPGFGDVILKKGEEYRQRTVYAFSVTEAVK